MGITLKKKKAEEKLIGAYLPQYLTSFISVFAVANGVSKSCIIKGVIEDWYSVQYKKGYYIKIIQNNIIEKWDAKQTKQKYTFEKYKEEMRIYLTKKLDVCDVDAVMEGIK